MAKDQPQDQFEETIHEVVEPQPVVEEQPDAPQATVTVASYPPGTQAYFFPNLAPDDEPITIYATSLEEATAVYAAQKGVAPAR